MTNENTAHITPQTKLAPAINGWRIYLKDQGSSPHTVKAFSADMRLLASYLPPDQELGQVTTAALNSFLDWMQKERGVPCSPKTLARRITSIKAFFRWLHDKGILALDPAEAVIQKSVMAPLPTVLTTAEVTAVLEVADRHRFGEKIDTRYAVLLRLLLATGIKKGECLNISLNHIQLDAPNGPFLFVRYADPRYRYKERKLSLPEDWLPAYQDYMAQYQPTDQLFTWSPRRLEYLLEDLSNEAGLDKHLSFDMCRWTCSLMDYRSGLEYDKIRQKLGISKVQWREVGMKLRKLDQQVEP